MPYDARHIANYLLDRADDTGLALTQISLQKTVFYSHGWYLVLQGDVLVMDDFEAWTYGPVVRSLRDSFRVVGRAPIKTVRAVFYDPFSDETAYQPYEISDFDKAFLDRMLGFYGKLDPFVLVGMTHRDGSPWSKTKSDNSKANLGKVISGRDIALHFERLLRNRPQHKA